MYYTDNDAGDTSSYADKGIVMQVSQHFIRFDGPYEQSDMQYVLRVMKEDETTPDGVPFDPHGANPLFVSLGKWFSKPNPDHMSGLNTPLWLNPDWIRGVRRQALKSLQHCCLWYLERHWYDADITHTHRALFYQILASTEDK